MQIQTVLGPIEPAELGRTLMHEHVIFDLRSSGFGADFLADPALAVAELGFLVQSGGRAVLEASLPGIGRDVATLAAISRAASVHIIAVTGFYVEATHPAFVARSSADELARLMVRELTDGIEGSKIRAGSVKFATSETITEAEKKVMRAAVLAQRQTGAAITTHTTRGKSAGEQVDILRKEGADLSRVIVGHQHWNRLDTLLRLVDQGVTVEFENLGRGEPPADSEAPSEDETLHKVTALVERGYAGQITLSHDFSRPLRYIRNGGKGYSHLLKSFVPSMAKAGVSSRDIEQILVGNPARLLAF